MATPQDFSREREFMGIGNLPYADYWNIPPEGQRQNFTEEARQALRVNDMFQDEQNRYVRDRKVSQDANALIDVMPYMQDSEVEQALMSNPRIQGTPEIKTIEDFLARRQRVNTPKPQSDAVLGPRILEKITNPDDRDLFKRRVLDEGYSVEEAQDLYYNDDYNRKQETRLGELGVPPEEYESLKVNNRYDMGKVGQRLFKAQQDRERAKYDLRGDTPAARQVDAISSAMRSMAKQLNDRGIDPSSDPVYKRLEERLAPALERQLSEFGVEPVSQQTVPGAVNMSTADQVNPVSVVPQNQSPESAQYASFAEEAFTKGLTPEQAQAEFEKRNSPVKQEIDNAWTDSKLALGSRLLKLYPNEDRPSGNPAALLARAIVKDESAPGDTGSMTGSITEWETGTPAAQPYSQKVLKELGINPSAVIFEEPGNERTGSQAVKANEVLKAWAKDFLEAKGLLNAKAPAPQAETEADRIAAKYLKK